MALNDVFRLTASFSGPQGQLWQWVWHMRQDTAQTLSPTQLIDEVESNLALAWADIASHVTSTVLGDTLQLAAWDDIAKQFDTIRTNDISSLQGSALTEYFPGNVAPYCTFPTNLGRSIGKKFLFGIVEAAVTNGALGAGLLADIALFAAQFNNVLTAGLNDFSPGNFNLASEIFRQWSETEVGVGIFTGSQYRRLPGRGI